MCGAEKFTSKYASRRDLVHEYAAYDEEKKELPLLHPASIFFLFLLSLLVVDGSCYAGSSYVFQL